VKVATILNVTFADKFLKTHKFLSLSKLSQTRREYVTTGHEMSTGFPRPPSSMPAGSGVRCFHDEGVRDDRTTSEKGLLVVLSAGRVRALCAVFIESRATVDALS
jgi:hypothetical protein